MNPYANRFTALVDACVLAGALRRNLLLSLAEAGLFRPRWSVRIMAETGDAIGRITKGNADIPKQILMMQRAFPEANVDGFEQIEHRLVLPDPRDTHVLAAAVRAKVQVIVTDNIKDFPAETLAAYDIEAKSADTFLTDCIQLDELHAIQAIETMRQRFKNPEYTWKTLTGLSEKRGLIHTAAAMRKYAGLLHR